MKIIVLIDMNRPYIVHSRFKTVYKCVPFNINKPHYKSYRKKEDIYFSLSKYECVKFKSACWQKFIKYI